jgi:hypothetical protein
MVEVQNKWLSLGLVTIPIESLMLIMSKCYYIAASCCTFHLVSISFLEPHVIGFKIVSLHVSTNVVIIRC